MAKEIERKFLLKDSRWDSGARGVSCQQGYLLAGRTAAVRVRIMDGRATLNVKGVAAASPNAVVRDEFEYPIPLEDAEIMLANLCKGCLIEKTRYRVPFGGMTWAIDRFSGANAGLVIAEIELDHADQPFPKPPWLGAEVSHDARYLNTSLCRHPYTSWPQIG